MAARPLLNLKDSTYQIEVSFVPIPYQAQIKYADGTSDFYITSLDEFGDTVVTKKYVNLPTISGQPIFTSDKQLVELIPENLPVEGVSVENDTWKLQGEKDLISFINLDGFSLNYGNYKTSRNEITEDTPYTVVYNNHAFQEYIFTPELQGIIGNYSPISYTDIVLI